MSAARNQTGEWVASLTAGVIFGVGLALAGMTRPEKVRGFLDFTGAWDPSLAFVMGGAVLVHALAFRLITRRNSPVFAAKFALPTRRDLDAKLLGGAALFGVGWGLGGFCPGPGITSLVGGAAPVAFFVLAMLVGIAVTARLEDSAKPVVDATRTPAAR
jgi:uncharacterized membrane protein YedE/YeeE